MKVKIKNTPQSGPIQVEDNNIKQISPNLFQILGKPHSEGGTDVQYLGQKVEMQSGEPISLNSQGDLVAFGKLKIPGQKQTFESAAKDIAQKEVKVVKQADKAVNLINSNDPYDKFQSLAFNTGIVLGNAAQIKQQELDQQRESLGNIQQVILNTADNLGIDPKKVVKMKNGGKLKVKIKGLPSKNGFLPQMQNGGLLPFGTQPIPSLATTYGANYQPAPIPVIPTPLEAVAPNAQGTLAQRNNNPGNLRFNNQPGATRGDRGFAKFDSYESGYQALLNDLKAKQTGKTRTGLKPTSSIQDLINVYAPKADNNDPQSYARTVARNLGVPTNTPIGQIDTNQLAKYIAQVEDAAYARSKGNTPTSSPTTQPQIQTPAPGWQGGPIRTNISTINSLTQIPFQPADPQGDYYNIQTGEFQPNQPDYMTTIGGQNTRSIYNTPRTSLRNNLNPLSFLPEIGALLDRPDFVPLQQYTPNLYEPYRVSFADRIAQNQSNFNQVAQLASGNPAALNTLAANLYSANNQVLADEFRQNQAIQNQVTNQNTELLNQAQMTNIGLRDQQFVRQAGAQAVTERNKQNALASISDKIQQNQIFGRNQSLVENLFNYRPDESGQMQYISPDAQLNIFGQPLQQQTFQALSPEERKAYTEEQKLKMRQDRLKFDQNKLNYQRNNWINRNFF